MSEQTFFGHPRGLSVLFFAEMWERFSYYGMRGLLVLYLTKHWLFDDAMAAGIYASYTALVYLTPVLGGLIADRYLGFRKAVIAGAVLLCLGHLGMAVEGDPAYLDGGNVIRDEGALQIFYLSLAFIIVGVGLLKPNISSIVGDLYAPDDARRDSGFTIFYMGINLGSVLATLTCGYLGETYGWAYGFGLAGLGMLVGLVTFVRGRERLEGRGEAPVDLAARSAGLTLAMRIYLCAGAMVLGAWWLLQHQAVVGTLLTGASFLAVAGVVAFIWTSCGAEERRRMGLLLFLTAYSVIFWALFEQAGTSLNLFADRNVDRQVFGAGVTAAQLQFLNPGFIILLAPVFSMLWQSLHRRGLEPSHTAKFGLAVSQVGLGFLVLVYGIDHADSAGQVALVWLALAYLVHTTGELCLSPVGLSMVTKLAVPKVLGLMMGVWFLSSSVANYVGGLIAAMASVEGGEAAAAQESLVIYQETFYLVGVVGLATGLALLVIAPLLTRLVFPRRDAPPESL